MILLHLILRILHRHKRLGKTVYRATAEKSRFVMKWTCHSGRIRATALLFGKYRDPLLIKKRLRWESDKFEVYSLHSSASKTARRRSINRY